MAELVALLDFGSNAVRFVLARVKPGAGFRVLRQERTQTRLGGGRPGTLPPAAVRLALDNYESPGALGEHHRHHHRLLQRLQWAPSNRNCRNAYS